MLSNRLAPAGTSLQACNSARETKSNRRDSTCSTCSPRSHEATSCPLWTVTRVGTVLMNMPTIDSTPANSAGRPDTVVPNTTSRWPLYRDSSNPQAPCTTVFTVSAFRCATSRSRADSSPDSATRTVSLDSARCASTGGRSYGSAVGASNPASTRRQYPSAAGRSCSANHCR